MRGVPLKKLKRGQMFTLFPLPDPEFFQVFIRDDYCRSIRCYAVYKYADVFSSTSTNRKYLDVNTIVYIGFKFNKLCCQ